MQGTYSKKTGIPVFEPDNRNIELKDCVNVDKYVTLMREIEKEEQKGTITKQESNFLKLCSTRWIQFKYSDVAQYFCTKASPKMQEMLQRNAMVLIDVGGAFENSVVASKKYVEGMISNHSDLGDFCGN